MKYKVGDVVRLKSAEELKKMGNWHPIFADDYGGTNFKITGVGESCYISEDISIDEDSIDGLESIAEMPKQGTTYTFDELKKRVDALKDYATKLSSELNVGLSIDIETEAHDIDVGVSCRKEFNGFSRINIMD